jgi:hypothetical protein
MKTAFLFFVLSASAALAAPLASSGQEKLLKTDSRAFSSPSRLSPEAENRLADAIFVLEGGNGTKWPYGIKVRYKSTSPRQACLNTIRHKHADWVQAGAKGDFRDYLADRYCPAKDDPTGNRNWHSNIHKLLCD